MDHLYAAQPFSYATPADFKPRPLPLPAFSDAAMGRRVEVVGLRRGLANLNGRRGTVVEVRPAAARYTVEFDDGEKAELPRRHLLRPCVAPLNDALPPTEAARAREYNFEARLGVDLGLAADMASLLVTSVDPKGQAWEAGVRPGHTLVSIQGRPMNGLDEARGALDAAKRQGLASSSVTMRIDAAEVEALRFFGLRSN
jgi:hypothetical protein